MSEVQTGQSAQVTPPPTFGDLEKPAAPTESNPQAKPGESNPSGEPAKPAEAAPKADATESKDKPTEKTETGKEDKPAPPEKYELKLSENSLMDSSGLDRIAAFAKAQGLSQEDAQNLVKSQEQDVATLIADQKARWTNEVAADKEIGGEGLKENLTLANDVVKRFASDSLKTYLDRSGFGSHPELVRMLVKIGKASANDKFVHPNATQKSQKTAGQVFYDNTPNP